MDTSSRLRDALLISTSLTTVYALAFYWRMEKPFWAAFTVLIMVGLPTMGQTLQKGLLRIGGTLAGAGSALVLFAVFQQNRTGLILALAVYLGVTQFLMLGNPQWKYFHFIASLVGMIVVVMASQYPAQAWQLAVARTEETLLGIATHTFITLLFLTPTSRTRLEETMAGIVSIHQQLDATPPALAAGLRAKLSTLQEAATLLLPAVELENTVDFFRRREWREALIVSKELADAQDTLPEKNIVSDAVQAGTVFPANSASGTILHHPGAKTFASDGKLAAKRQRFNALLDFLLHNGPKPPPFPEKRLEIRDAFEKNTDRWRATARIVTLFLGVSSVWVLFDPPGMESMGFVEMSMMFALTGLFAGDTPPSKLFWPFTRGVAVMFLPYAFIYPLITGVTGFLALTFFCCFAVCFLFAGNSQALDRLGYTIPWLAIGQFTNTPQFSVLKYLMEGVMITSGLMLLVLLQAIFFPGLKKTAPPPAAPSRGVPHAA